MSHSDPQFKLRIHPHALLRLREHAIHNRRSVNAEIAARLDESFEAPEPAPPPKGVTGTVVACGSDDERDRRERIALALLIAMCPVGPNGPGKYAIVNAIDAADRFIAELDGEPY